MCADNECHATHLPAPMIRTLYLAGPDVFRPMPLPAATP